MHVKFLRVQPNALIECGPLGVVQVHCHIYLMQNREILIYTMANKLLKQNNKIKKNTLTEREESRPQLRLPVVQKLRLGFQKGRKEITMSVLILAPILKVLKDRV